MLHKDSPKIYKINGVGVNLENYFPLKSETEKEDLKIKNGFSADDFILLYTAEFIPRKNHKLIFDILPTLRENIPFLKVVLCGKGDLLQTYTQYASDNKMDYILFTGYTKQVADFCRLSDLLVMPSYQEGLPMAMIEAIATGLPVVASKIRGHTDVIENGFNGFLIAPDDEKGFEETILTLYQDSGLRNKMSEANILKSQNYRTELSVQKMAEIYKSLM